MHQRFNFDNMPQVFFCHAYWSPRSAIVFGRCARVRLPSRQFLRGFSLWIFNAISSSVSFELLVGHSQVLWLDNPTTVPVFDPNIFVSCFLRWMTGVLPCLHPCGFYFLIKMMIFPMHVGDRVCPWSLFHCQGNFSVFCSFIRMLQLEETLLCKQCAQCVVCLWLCFVSAVPNVDNFCIFILPIVWIFWLFVALICDLWRWTERSMIILQRHSGSFHFLFFTLDLWGCYQEEFNLLHWKPKVAGESDSQFIFESPAHRFVCFFWGQQMFEYRRPSSWCPFLICTQYTVSGSAEIMHWIVSRFVI